MGFPNDEGATEFLRAFRAAVYPERWQVLKPASTPLPPVLLDTGGSGDERCARRQRVLDSLERALRTGDGRAVAFSRPQQLPADRPGEELLTLRVGRDLRTQPPRHVGELRLRDFEFVARMVTHAIRLARLPREGDGALTDAELNDRLQGRELRDALYAERVAEAKGPAHHLAKLVPAPDGGNLVLAYLSRLLSHPLFYSLPRKLWDRRWGHRLLRSRRYGWYRAWLHLAHPARSVFDQVGDVIVAQGLALRGPAHERQNALLELEKLLLRALLSDLHRSHPARLAGPWKRRRRTRRVVLLELPAADTPQGHDAARFLQAYRSAYRAPGSASLFVVGAGEPEGHPEAAGQTWHRQDVESLAVVGQHLTDPPAEHGDVEAAPWILGRRFADPAFAGEGLPVARLRPPAPMWGPRLEATAIGVVLAALIGTGVSLSPLGGSDEDTYARCLDGSAVSRSAGKPEEILDLHVTRNALRDDDPAAAYRKVLAQIEKNNRRAVDDEKKTAAAPIEEQYVVRTVVYVAPSPTEGAYKALSELRGIWLAQSRFNTEAHRDSSRSRVELRVDVRDAGPHFERAEKVADGIVREVERTRAARDHSTVVGVIGFAESRHETRTAARVLSEHQVPAISTTASADAMEKAGPYYRPMAPNDDRESTLAVQLAHEGPVIESDGAGDGAGDGPGRCESATQAVVVSTEADLYSNEIGAEFVRKFDALEPGGAKMLRYSGDSGDPAEIAQQICGYVTANPRTVVYWSSRVNSFSSFLSSYTRTECTGRTLTVIGGNDITNAELNGDFKYNVSELRLYHTAHVLPAGHELANNVARRYVRNYAYYAGADDKWRNDGHGPMAHDAYLVMSAAADDANASNRQDVTPAALKSKLDNRIALQGTSGALRYPQSNPGSKPPRDKAIVIEMATEGEPRLVAYCGAFGLGKELRRTTWGPDDSLDCPADSR
ncbi:hypothetical protein [Streptomyces sp. NPDC050145]|uniref:hypothetical protein n=1 Tax=Streptomyces sp. NPDC050145 TaxID=3365602 RepID=UPI0037A1F753